MTYISTFIDVLLWGFLFVTSYVIAWKTHALYFGKGVKQLVAHGASGHELDEQMERLEDGLSILAVCASTAAFVGLAGTVVHIIEALQKLGGSGLDIGVISGPIAVALYATLKGLASAIPAAAAYTLFGRRTQVIESRTARQALKSKQDVPGDQSA